MGTVQSTNGEYAIRPFEAGDTDAFLELYARVFDADRGRAWFDWKYADNPYVDHVPVVVAEREGELVGARPFFALDMSVDGQRELALQPGDAMVHPDHRRQGLFTRMTEAAIERYEGADPEFFFNFPNHRSAPGNLKLGWETVTEQATYYRIHDPGAFGPERPGQLTALASTVAKPLLDGYNRIANARTGPVDGVTVGRHASVPSTTLSSLAATQAGSGIRVWRDQRFYEWRFDNPTWEYEAYVARKAGEPIAGMVVGTAASPDGTKTQVTDLAPLPDRLARDALDALFHRLVRDHADADVLIAPSIVPRSAAARAGFRSDDRPPLATVATQTVHMTRSLTDGWTVNGVDIRDEGNWRLTFSEQDSS